eukprot:4850050-Pyramimonas_sp.AAC.1
MSLCVPGKGNGDSQSSHTPHRSRQAGVGRQWAFPLGFGPEGPSRAVPAPKLLQKDWVSGSGRDFPLPYCFAGEGSGAVHL